MTFSDSRVVEFMNENFVYAWESVSPVRTVSFDLGEGRSVNGTISGEIALYFCTPDGHVFDILPALQSPAATLQAMHEAKEFFGTLEMPLVTTAIQEFHRERMKEIAGINLDDSENTVRHLLINPTTDEEGKRSLYQSQQGEKSREERINEAVDEATRAMRVMVHSKTVDAILVDSDRNSRKTSPFIVVEPGGRDYYRWETALRFIQSDAWSHPNQFNAVTEVSSNKPIAECTPDDWKQELFLSILKQPLDQGGHFEYDSDSLEAIRIIQE